MPADDAHALADNLIAAYRDAQARIDAELARIASDPLRWAQRDRLDAMRRRIDVLLAHVDDTMRSWVAEDGPVIFAIGSRDAEALGFVQADLRALEQLLGDTFDSLLKATRHMRLTTKQLVRSIARREITAAHLTGKSLEETKRALVREFNEQGIWAITYKDGSRVGIGPYASMVVRTTTGLAYNLGATSGPAQFYEVIDGAGCGWAEHNDPDRAAGTIRSKEECRAHPLAHPNCRRSFAPRSEITNREQAAAAKATEPAFTEALAAPTRSEAMRASQLAQRTARVAQPRTGRP